MWEDDVPARGDLAATIQVEEKCWGRLGSSCVRTEATMALGSGKKGEGRKDTHEVQSLELSTHSVLPLTKARPPGWHRGLWSPEEVGRPVVTADSKA